MASKIIELNYETFNDAVTTDEFQHPKRYRRVTLNGYNQNIEFSPNYSKLRTTKELIKFIDLEYFKILSGFIKILIIDTLQHANSRTKISDNNVEFLIHSAVSNNE